MQCLDPQGSTGHGEARPLASSSAWNYQFKVTKSFLEQDVTNN